MGIPKGQGWGTGWTRRVPANALSPLLCVFLDQPSAATRPRSLWRNCQIKMNHLAHNGRGAYRGRAGPRQRLISAAHAAGANEAGGGSRIRARGEARAGAAQHGHARPQGAKREHPSLLLRDGRQPPPVELPVRFLRPSPCALQLRLPLPGLFPGGALSTTPLRCPSRRGDSLPSFPFSPCAIDRKAQGAGGFHCFWAVCAGGRVESACVSGRLRWLLPAWAFGERSCAGV